MEYTNPFLYKTRLLFVGLLIFLSICLLWNIVSAHHNPGEAHGNSGDSDLIVVPDSPNSVTIGLIELVNSSARAVRATGQSISTAVAGVGHSAAQGIQFIGSGIGYAGQQVFAGARYIARGLGTGIGVAAGAVTDGIIFVIHIPGNMLGYISKTPVVNAMIRPAEHAPVPIIDPDSPALAEAKAAIAKPKQPDQPAETPMWPIHGSITTRFGVAHWPYQPTHTGLDISDGKRSGATPVRPFKSGKVIEASWSKQGLGNHVVIDHGSGITSVYGHLYSIAVTVGQQVDQNNVVGLEGSTGVSTGTHLHFEIRVNGQAADPHQFITGQP